MDPREIEAIISRGIETEKVEVHGDGRHFQALIVSPAFAGKSLIQRHRIINALLKEHIDSEVLHAISMRTKTPEEWSAEQS